MDAKKNDKKQNACKAVKCALKYVKCAFSSSGQQ